MLNQFTRSTVGQDLIEYALLGAVFAFLTFATWESVTGTIQRAVLRSNQQIQDLACTPNPLGGVRGGQCEP